MAPPIRLETEGAVYHVIARGNERKAIFCDDPDREEYLRRLARYRERFGFKLLAYCLMDNHLHLAIERGPVQLSRVMRALQGSYTQWFNVRHGRVGHLFRRVAASRYRLFMGAPDDSPYEGVETHEGTVKGDEQVAQATFRKAGSFVPKRGSVSIAHVTEAVARHNCMEPAALGRQGSYRDLARLRALTALVPREVAGHFVPSVARHFHREESTLGRGVLKLEREITGNPRWRRQVEALTATLRLN